MSNKKISFIFFGTPDLAVFVLEELEKGGFVPTAVVTAPDRPAGRGMHLTPPPVKVWAQERNIPIFQPEKIDVDFLTQLKAKPSTTSPEGEMVLGKSYQLGIVAAYGKIIPQAVLDLFPHGMLNVHPSLLPKYRGPSPVEASILNGDDKTGVTIMEVDAKMDAGPILAQQVLEIPNSKQQDTNNIQTLNTQIPKRGELAETLFRMGGRMLVGVIPQWVASEIQSTPQNHDNATYTKKLKKEDGLVDLADDPETNWRKFRAYTPWPGVYFFAEVADDRGSTADSRGLRVKITDASFENGRFVIKKVIPEGKSEMEYAEWNNHLSS